MNIGRAAEKSAVPAKAIRHYESVSLIGPAERTASGYRVYDERDVQTLRFVRRARNLGFSVKQVADLLALWQDREGSSADANVLTQSRLGHIDRHMAELQSMRDMLEHLMVRCHGDVRPECPILDDLAGEDEEQARGVRKDVG